MSSPNPRLATEQIECSKVKLGLDRHAAPAEGKEIAALYFRANKSDVAELLETLAAVGNSKSAVSWSTNTRHPAKHPKITL